MGEVLKLFKSMIRRPSREAEVHFEQYLEKAEALCDEYKVVIATHRGVMHHVYRYGEKKIIMSGVSAKRMCATCASIYDTYPDAKCRKCGESK